MSVIENDGDDEYEVINERESEESEWELADFYSSNDSGSDFDWAP